MKHIKMCPNCNIPLKTIVRSGSLITECCECDYKNYPNDLRIEEMYAYVSVDPSDGNEGIITVSLAGQPYPMVGADKERMMSMREHAIGIAKKTKIKVRLKRFKTMRVIEEFDYREKEDP